MALFSPKSSIFANNNEDDAKQSSPSLHRRNDWNGEKSPDKRLGTA